MRAPEKRLSPFWPSHFLWPSQCGSWCVSVSVQPELNPIISSGAEADSRLTAHPGVERLSSRFSRCLSEQAARHLRTPAPYLLHDKHFYLTNSCRSLNLKAGFIFDWPSSGWHFFISLMIWCLFIRHESSFCTISMASYGKTEISQIRAQKLQVCKARSSQIKCTRTRARRTL